METMTKNKTALVTGATTGIGYELAKLLALDGYDIIAVARTQTDLEKVSAEFQQEYGVKVEIIAKDLFSENSAAELYEEVTRLGYDIDILVNDAGQAVFGLFAETDIAKQIKIIHLNIVSLTTLTYHFLKDMLARDSGKILQVASTLSQIPDPYFSVYAATKSYVLAFTEGVISEIKSSGVTMTALLPPVTDTDFYRKADALKSKIVKEGDLTDPAYVARFGYEGLKAGKDKVFAGFTNSVIGALTNIIPNTVLADQLKKASGPAENNK